MRMYRRTVARFALLAGSLVGCSEPLSVNNKNNPDADALYATPSGTETIVSKLLQQMHQGQYASSDALWPQTTVMSGESYASVANFGMSTRGAIPRQGIDNVIGNQVAVGNFRDFDHLTRNARGAARAVNALNGFTNSGLSPADLARDKSFAFFSLGFALGHLGLFYDSASVITPATAADSAPPFSGAQGMVAASLQMLDSALAIANSPAATQGTGGWPIPATWLSSASSGPTLAEWRRIIRSYKARFRAGVARTPAERTAVDWNAVVDDATNGLQQDLVVQLGPGRGWTNAFIQQAAVPGGWHQMPYFYIGMADTTGGYDTWLATALNSRSPFLIVTPDRRFPRGETRAAQQAFQNPQVPAPGVYFRNRPTGEDTPGDAWGTSFYDNFRFYTIRANNGQGQFPIMTQAEVDMLAAEGYIRTGRFSQAATLIDRYRVRNGLPSVAGLTALGQPVPGGRACIPRIPTSSGTSTMCGDLYEAMKYEKRMETAFTGIGQWFIDHRGWGDLIVGTPLEWPVPYQEMDARRMASYSTVRRAARGTYGF